MKSFNSRLQNDLFPKKPAAFDRMVRQKLDELCGQPEESQAATVRFSAAESKRQPVKTRSKLFGRIGAVAVAAILVVSTLAAGAIAVLAGREKSTPAVPVAEAPTTSSAPIPTEEPAAANTVRAATVDEFLAAIASDTTVVLTGDVYNLSAASGYGVESGNQYTWREVEDGYELVLRNLEHFRIVGSENAVIETDPRHAAVIEAEHCVGLSLSDLTVGHTKRPEKCSGEVICLTECADTRIERCALYGCGSWGIAAWYSENLTVTESEIYECSSGALHIWECAGVSVSESVIRNCGGGGTLADLIYIQDSGVSIRNCDIYENTTESSLIYVGDAEPETCQISLVGVDVHDNRLTHGSKYVLDFTNPDPDESDRMIVDGCAFRNNGDNHILPGSSRAFDLDGNELREAELQAMTLKRNGSVPTEQPSETESGDVIVSVTPPPAVTEEPTVQRTVHVSTVEELIAAIAPNTEIVLAAGEYDLGARVEPLAAGNPYCAFEPVRYASYDRCLILSGVDNLTIRPEAGAEGADCIFAAIRESDCEAILAARNCTGLTISGRITFCGSPENNLLLESCSGVRVEGCTLNGGGKESLEIMPNGIRLEDCSFVTVSDCQIEGCAAGIIALTSNSIAVSDCEISECLDAAWIHGIESIAFTDCSVHDCRNEDLPSADGEGGDASYLISIDGISDRAGTASFANCEFYNNKSTFFFSADGVGAVTLSGLEIHDNDFERLFEFEPTSDVAGDYRISNCDVERNKIGTFLFNGLPEARVVLSGTSIADNEIETVFYGDVTVFGCAFANPDVTHWIGVDEVYEDLKTFIRGADGNELGEDALSAMTLQRDAS